MNLTATLAEITELLDSAEEWLIVRESGKSFALRQTEIEITLEREKLFCGFLDDQGFQIWRIVAFQIKDKNLTIDATRSFGRTRERIKFVSRVSNEELNVQIELARIEKANQIAALIVKETPQTNLVKVALNKENGRFAEIVFENSTKKQIAAIADVSESLSPENLLTTAIFRLNDLQTRRKNPINKIEILAEKKIYGNLRKLHALLNENWQSKISIKEISRLNDSVKTERIVSQKILRIEDLWREKPPKITTTAEVVTSRTAQEIIKFAPEKIDVVFTRHGETIRFYGLPFARVRRIGDAERAWFGTMRERRILNETTRAEFFDLLENLQTYRRFDSPNKRHEFYRLAPEAWLESILRRNVNLLDSNLLLSPVHHQFRTAGERIDLLALRRDGRLIIIELKVEPDSAMIFQAADYWRKIELQRQRGKLQAAKIFGELEISDEPTIVYLAAPTLSFHRNFEFLSKIISPKIEFYKFDLNENWREDLRVMNVAKI